MRSAEIVLTHSALRRDLSEYSALFVGNIGVIEDELKEKLLAYAAQGGQLFLLGANTAELFAADTGISIQKKVTSGSRSARKGRRDARGSASGLCRALRSEHRIRNADAGIG